MGKGNEKKREREKNLDPVVWENLKNQVMHGFSRSLMNLSFVFLPYQLIDVKKKEKMTIVKG